MNAFTREDGIQRTLGRLEQSVENINQSLDALAGDVKTGAADAAHSRGEIANTLNEINDKVDPLRTELDSLKMTVRAHEVVLASYATRESELRGAARLGRWLIHAFWLFCTALAVVFGDRLKFPLQKLLAVFK